MYMQKNMSVLFVYINLIVNLMVVVPSPIVLLILLSLLKYELNKRD